MAAAEHQNSSSLHQVLSHGRGGAGNHGHVPTDDEPVDLTTPTLKGDHYPTGRGGFGNITKNTDPEAARRAQDVVGDPPRVPTSDVHVGRGGAANVAKPRPEETVAVKGDNIAGESAAHEGKRDAATVGLAEKGKAWLFKKSEKA